MDKKEKRNAQKLDWFYKHYLKNPKKYSERVNICYVKRKYKFSDEDAKKLVEYRRYERELRKIGMEYSILSKQYEELEKKLFLKYNINYVKKS